MDKDYFSMGRRGEYNFTGCCEIYFCMFLMYHIAVRSGMVDVGIYP